MVLISEGLLINIIMQTLVIVINDKDTKIEMSLDINCSFLRFFLLKSINNKQMVKKLTLPNIVRSINTMVRKPMAQLKRYRQIYKKADPQLYRKQHRMTDPLFLLKLHSHLSVIYQHLNVFCILTNHAKAYIETMLPVFSKQWKKMKAVTLYDRKFRAYYILLQYLRGTRNPSRMKIEWIVKYGIYGETKGKFTDRVKHTIQRCLLANQNCRTGSIASPNNMDKI